MRNRYVFVGDLLAFALAAYGAFALRFDLLVPLYRAEFLPYLVTAVGAKPVVYFGFGMYRRFWRYASLHDLVALGLASCASALLMGALVAVAVLNRTVFEFSRSVLLTDWLLTFCLTAGLRLSLRLVAETQQLRQNDSGSRRILVAGAGDAGIMVVREMQRNPQLKMIPVGFVDDDPVKWGKRILGLPVLGPTRAAASAAKTKAVDEVVVAMPTAPGPTLREIARALREAQITSRIVPGVYELLGGLASVSRLRHVEIADLLRRAQVSGDLAGHAYLNNATVLVTGGGGSIGRELCRQIAHAQPACLIVLGHGENSIFEATEQLRRDFPSVRTVAVIADVRDRRRLEGVFDEFRPTIVFHAAAHKHVPLMEANAPEAVSNNILGTSHVVACALGAGTQRFVLVSTDKAVAPSSLMGASKRMAEMIVREAAASSGRAFLCVRFGNVLGSRGSVVPLFKQQIQDGGPIRITHPDMKRFFMTIPEAVHLTMLAGGMGAGGELYVLRMGEPVRIVDLAKDLITLSGLASEEIPIVFTGIRAGEKLEEALWEDGAVVESTAHPDVLRVTEPVGGTDAIMLDALEELERLTREGDRAAIEAALSRWIPSYVPIWMQRAMAPVVSQV